MAKAGTLKRKADLQKQWNELNIAAGKTNDQNVLRHIWGQMDLVTTQLKEVNKALLWEDAPGVKK